MTAASRRVELYTTRGWCPVPWAHHPAEVKEALRIVGMRPALKQCWRNSQKLLLRAHDYGLLPGLVYREGWAHRVLTFEHAWLEWQSETLDLTLLAQDGVQYLHSNAYTVEQVREALWTHRAYQAVNPRALWEAYGQLLRPLGLP